MNSSQQWSHGMSLIVSGSLLVIGVLGLLDGGTFRGFPVEPIAHFILVVIGLAIGGMTFRALLKERKEARKPEPTSYGGIGVLLPALGSGICFVLGYFDINIHKQFGFHGASGTGAFFRGIGFFCAVIAVQELWVVLRRKKQSKDKHDDEKNEPPVL